MSKQWKVRDQHGRDVDTRHWWPNLAGAAVILVLTVGLLGAPWAWWLSLAMAGLLGQVVRDSLQIRRHRRIAVKIQKAAADRELGAWAQGIRREVAAVAPDPEDWARAERVAQLRTNVEAGLPFLDYDTGTLWSIEEAAELLRVEDRRAQHVAELAQLRTKMHDTYRHARGHEDARRAGRLDQRIAAVQRQIDMIDGKPVPETPDDRRLIMGQTGGGKTKTGPATVTGADVDRVRWAERVADATAEAMLSEQLGRRAGEAMRDAMRDQAAAQVVERRLVRFSDGGAYRLTSGDMQALIQNGPDMDPRGTFVLPSGGRIPGARVHLYAAELAELLRIESGHPERPWKP